METLESINVKLKQGEPSVDIWKLWMKDNKLWASKQGKLMCSLGKWLQLSSKQRMRRLSYCDPYDNTVYMFDTGGFRKFKITLT